MKKDYLTWLATKRSPHPHFENGLQRMALLLSLRGAIHQYVPVIHIAGTNGKGSTIAHLTQLLRCKQLKVGVFSSPYIINYNEQITINGMPISDDTLYAYSQVYKAIYEQNKSDLDGLTEFELLTAIAFDYFYHEKVDVAIMEVGMGGKLDSTNVCVPILTAITTIGLDHIALLGDTLEKIAYQKGGIIKQKVPVISGLLPKEAQHVIEQLAKENNSLHITYKQSEAAVLMNKTNDHGNVTPQNHQKKECDNVFVSKWLFSQTNGERFEITSAFRQKEHYTTKLLGIHQVDNASLALMLMDTYCTMKQLPLLNQEEVQNAFDLVYWPARLEQISDKPLILLDGAHNPHAINRLIQTLDKRYKQPKTLLFACIKTKDLTTMLKQLSRLNNSRLYVSSFDDDKAVTKQVMQTYSTEQALTYVDWKAFVANYLKNDTQELLVITGSLYFMSQVRQFILEEKNG